MTTEITRIKQADGTTRFIHAQDEEHAIRAKAILHNDPAMIDRLDGVDGIRVSVDVDSVLEKKVEKLKITMSERRPITIVKADWPLIARADRHDGAVECQANHEWTIRVRQHADGRRIVYGWLTAGNGGVPMGWRGAEGGFLVSPPRQLYGLERSSSPDEDETIRAIRRVGGIIGDDVLAAECIADLPAEELEGA